MNPNHAPTSAFWYVRSSGDLEIPTLSHMENQTITLNCTAVQRKYRRDGAPVDDHAGVRRLRGRHDGFDIVVRGRRRGGFGIHLAGHALPRRLAHGIAWPPPVWTRQIEILRALRRGFDRALDDGALLDRIRGWRRRRDRGRRRGGRDGSQRAGVDGAGAREHSRVIVGTGARADDPRRARPLDRDARRSGRARLERTRRGSRRTGRRGERHRSRCSVGALGECRSGGTNNEALTTSQKARSLNGASIFSTARTRDEKSTAFYGEPRSHFTGESPNRLLFGTGYPCHKNTRWSARTVGIRTIFFTPSSRAPIVQSTDAARDLREDVREARIRPGGHAMRHLLGHPEEGQGGLDMPPPLLPGMHRGHLRKL